MFHGSSVFGKWFNLITSCYVITSAFKVKQNMFIIINRRLIIEIYIHTTKARRRHCPIHCTAILIPKNVTVFKIIRVICSLIFFFPPWFCSKFLICRTIKKLTVTVTDKGRVIKNQQCTQISHIAYPIDLLKGVAENVNSPLIDNWSKFGWNLKKMGIAMRKHKK